MKFRPSGIFIFGALFSFLISACQHAPTTSNRSTASTDMRDVNYKFDPAVVNAAKNEFHFLRTFVDYFYLLIQNNRDSLKVVADLEKYNGWCAGDAHAENFGVLQQKNSSTLFTINDYDDASYCPVSDDFFRLLVSSQLYDKNIPVNHVIDSYMSGLNGKEPKSLKIIDDMEQESQKKGTEPKPKKYVGNQFVLDSGMERLASNDPRKAELRSKLAKIFPGMIFLDEISTAKAAGGSAGVARFELLTKMDESLIHLELKELVRPATYPVSTTMALSGADRVMNAMKFEQNGTQSPYYGYVQIQGKDMMIRPKFHGDITVDLGAESKSHNEDLIEYEASILGGIHRGSMDSKMVDKYLKDLDHAKTSGWEKDIDLFAQFFKNKYQQQIGIQ